ncbi:hypothetical protein BGZ60DRAFT_397392 [Tricladium varicosporioides]|nr:hypothetical protein BGZ60DRAFT_397392 [Hymenoscyphus varicosporioides]
MPVIIKPSPSKAGHNIDPTVTTPLNLFTTTSKAWSSPNPDPDASSNKSSIPETRPILHSSFPAFSSPNPGKVIPYENGFVNGLIRAFNQDLHLTLRPDDVWLAILTQFNFFVNGKAELLRDKFVKHEGKKKLVIDFTPTAFADVDIGLMARKFASLIQENVKDPGLQKWIMPTFSTTTEEDKSVASVVMMGTFKAYFEYLMLCGCGFPSVTLLGEKEDWEGILSRIRELQGKEYHAETKEWCELLIPTVSWMIKSFDSPDSQAVRDFWLRVAHAEGPSASGIRTLSGWINAFIFWDENGKRIYSYSDADLQYSWGTSLEARKRLVLDGVAFPLISPASIPKGIVTCPVVVVDMAEGVQIDTTLVAGCVGMTLITDEGGTKVQPTSGWWMVEDSREAIR